mmetsp:Transcript_23046/g.42463  ORF Transcript_23046/g.42463 Transcript_23046/m.42463 type:complete len:117 (+) Transcript_23046:72-422(+)
MADPTMHAGAIGMALGCCGPTCFVGIPGELQLERLSPSDHDSGLAIPRQPWGVTAFFGGLIGFFAGGAGVCVSGPHAGIAAGVVCAVAVTAVAVRDMLRRRDRIRQARRRIHASAR